MSELTSEQTGEQTGKPTGEPPDDSAAAARWLGLAGKIAVAALATGIFAVTAIAWGTKQWVDDKIRYVPALDPDSPSIVDKERQLGDENFLLVGSDSRAGASPADRVGDTKAVPGARSDTLMLAHIPADRSRVVVVSFPRDLEIDRPACPAWDPVSGAYLPTTNPARNFVKINSAYQSGGPLCTTKVVQQLTGLSINHYIGIDFNGFKSMVDAVDGVRVCVQRPVFDDILGPIVDAPGPVELTGDKALAFVRARHVRGDPTSDYGRIRRQQRFISALMREAMSNRVLLDPGRLEDFVDAFAANTVADNLGVDQLLTLAQSLHGLDAGRVTFVTVPTTGGANARGNEELRADDTAALFRAIIDGTPLPGERPAAPSADPPAANRDPKAQAGGAPPGPTVQPREIRLQVLNGTERSGLAGQAARDLKAAGFDIVKVDGASEQVTRTVIRYAKEREAHARTVAAAVPTAVLREDPTMGTAIELVLGTNFDGRVLVPLDGAPLDGAPPGRVPPPSGPPPAPPALPDDLATVNAADTACA